MMPHSPPLTNARQDVVMQEAENLVSNAADPETPTIDASHKVIVHDGDEHGHSVSIRRIRKSLPELIYVV